MTILKRKKILILLIAILLIIFAVVLLVWRAPVLPVKKYGGTFSSFYAEPFGLDWKEAYRALFDDLGIRHIRLPAYWNEIEGRENMYDFSRLDWQITEAGLYQADVVLAVGRKLPRWPECHDPEWAASSIDTDENKFRASLLDYIQTTVERYRGNKAVVMWQIENEPYLPFGECKKYSTAMLDEEIGLIRSLDPTRPVMVTDSGELSMWVSAAKRSDVFGSTMYRSVYNKYFGFVTYPLPPSFFRLKRAIAELIVGKKTMIIVELQGEPWSREATYKLSADDHYKTMNPDTFKEILAYASKTGFDTFYIWGSEWWYWLKVKQNKPEMWNIVKDAVNISK